MFTFSRAISERQMNKLQISKETNRNKENLTTTKKTGRAGFLLHTKASVYPCCLWEPFVGNNKGWVMKGLTQATLCLYPIKTGDRWVKGMHMWKSGVPKLWSCARLLGTKDHEMHTWQLKAQRNAWLLIISRPVGSVHPHGRGKWAGWALGPSPWILGSYLTLHSQLL